MGQAEAVDRERLLGKTLTAQREARDALADKVGLGRRQLAAQFPVAPSPLQLKQARLIQQSHAAAVPAGPSFDLLWRLEGRSQCAEAFLVLGQQLEAQSSLVETSSTAGFVAHYRSPLLAFRSYRLSSNFLQTLGSDAVRHPTFTNRVTPHTTVCRFELDGECKDGTCPFLHRRDYLVESEDAILEDLAKSTPAAKSKASAARIWAAGGVANVSTKAPSRQQKRELPGASSILSQSTPPPPPPPPPMVDKVSSGAATTGGSEKNLLRFFATEETEEAAFDDLTARGLAQPHNVELWLRGAEKFSSRVAARALTRACSVNPHCERLWVAQLQTWLAAHDNAQKTEKMRRFESALHVSAVPYSATVWILFIEYCDDQVGAKLGKSRRALEFISAAEGISALEKSQAVLQLLLHRIRLMLDAGCIDIPLGVCALFEPKLMPRDFVNFRLICIALDNGARSIPHETESFFNQGIGTVANYVLLELPSDISELGLLIHRLTKVDSDSFFSMQDRLPYQVNLIRALLAYGDRAKAEQLLISLAKQCPDRK